VRKQTLQWLTNINVQPGKSNRPLLTPQEQRLLPLVAQGLTNREIAESLQLSKITVKNYLANIYLKLNIGRRSQIASFYAGSFKGSGAALPPPTPLLDQARS
jgi:DNA-binding NarL/FixJ family response regulator